MVFYKGVSDTNVSDNCIFHQTHNIYKNGNFEFIFTCAFLKNFYKKKKTVVVFYKKGLLWHFKAEFVMSTTKVITRILTWGSETIKKRHISRDRILTYYRIIRDAIKDSSSKT